MALTNECDVTQQLVMVNLQCDSVMITHISGSDNVVVHGMI